MNAAFSVWFLSGPDAPSGFDPSVLLNYGGVGVLAAVGLIAVSWLAKKRDEDWKTRAAEWAAREQQLIAQLELEQSRTSTARAEGSERAEIERRRADRLEQELSNLNIRVQTEVTTAMGSAAKAVADAMLFVQMNAGSGRQAGDQ